MIIAHANWPTLLKPGIRDKRKPKSAIKKVKAIPKSHNCDFLNFVCYLFLTT